MNVSLFLFLFAAVSVCNLYETGQTSQENGRTKRNRYCILNDRYFVWEMFPKFKGLKKLAVVTKVVDAKRDNERGNWVNKAEFLLSCLGYCIGIGNVWRFPYLCYRNGGGAFLIPYLLMLVLCGLPLYFLETSIGQFSSIGCISMFRIAPVFKGVGYATMIINILCTIYYSQILTYPLLFIKSSFGEILPWTNCNHTWNTNHCVKITDNVHIDANNYSHNKSLSTPSDEFFHYNILQISHGIDEITTVVWPLFWGNIFAWVFMYICVAKGVKSVGKVVYFTATFPFFVLFVLFMRGVTLPGAIDGIKFYIYPQWEHLLNLRVWADAAVQIFYSLGPGWGGIVNMASYNKFNNNNLLDSVLVPVINCATSIFAGFTVFSVLGFMSYGTGLPVSTVASGGPALAFITYPAAITMLPWPNLWSILFFSMLFFLGVDSCFVQLETITSAIIDECPSLMKWKGVVAFVACASFAILSTICATDAGMYIVQLMDWYCASIGIIFICLVESYIIGWTYGCENFAKDIKFMNKHNVHCIWILCWKYVTPIILVFIFITTIIWNTSLTYRGNPYPDWSITVGWTLCSVSVICIPIYSIYYLIFQTTGSILQRLKDSVKPTTNWGPADPIVAQEWRNMREGVTQLKIINHKKPLTK